MSRRNEALLVSVALCLLTTILPLSVYSHIAPSETAFKSSPAAREPDRGSGSTARRAPYLEQSIETDHFILRWTNRSRHAADNIPDPEIIHETARYLEHAWDKYRSAFGRAPYTAPGMNKIEVEFSDITGYGLASPPNGPIQFDAENWVKKPGIRQPTSAHELFHKLQYAFGYRTKWRHKHQYEWFTEGTAAWAEVFVWQRVSGAYKIGEIFKKPNCNLYDMECNTLPFWLFFQTQQQDDGQPYIPIAKLLESYETTGDPRKALRKVIEDNLPYSTVGAGDKERDRILEDYYALFARERTSDSWRHPSPGLDTYPEILGPDGKNIIPSLAVTEFRMERGDNYYKSAKVLEMGANYYRFKPAKDAGDQTLSLIVRGSRGGKYSYFIGWEKNGEWVNEPLLSGAGKEFKFAQKINPGAAESVMLVISGREKDAYYSINASLN